MNTDNAPALPKTVSPDGREIWGWAGEMSNWIHKQATLSELRKELSKCGTVCGDCEKWMKSRECPREHPGTGKRSGYSTGPSMNDTTCSRYEEKPDTTKRRADLILDIESLSSTAKATP